MTHSFWAGGLITVTGKNTHEAFKTYLSRGLQNTSNLPDDHLAVELAFLGHLLAEDKIDEAQQFVKMRSLRGGRPQNKTSTARHKTPESRHSSPLSQPL